LDRTWLEVARGFSVTFRPPAGIYYTDASGTTIYVGTEPYQHAHMVFASSKDLQGMPKSQVDEILNNIFRAMAFLEQPVEIFKE
jgi:hypothetical protein